MNKLPKNVALGRDGKTTVELPPRMIKKEKQDINAVERWRRNCDALVRSRHRLIGRDVRGNAKRSLLHHRFRDLRRRKRGTRTIPGLSISQMISEAMVTISLLLPGL